MMLMYKDYALVELELSFLHFAISVQMPISSDKDHMVVLLEQLANNVLRQVIGKKID